MYAFQGRSVVVGKAIADQAPTVLKLIRARNLIEADVTFRYDIQQPNPTRQVSHPTQYESR